MWFGILCRKVKKHQGIVNDSLGYSDKTSKSSKSKLKRLLLTGCVSSTCKTHRRFCNFLWFMWDDDEQQFTC